MIELGWLDTNLFVVPLFANDPHRPRCLAILRALEAGAATGWLDVVVVHELTYVLARTGIAELRSRSGIQAYILGYLLLDTIRAASKPDLIDTLERWATQSISFADARLAALARQRHLPVCSVNAADFPDSENTFFTARL